MTALVTANLALLSDAPEGVARLRSLIVELAVAGRLMPQWPDDESGAELAVRLAASKTQAVADGGRRTKALGRQDVPAWPFEIPASWTWQVLDDLLLITGGVTLGRKLAGRSLVAMPYLRVANVQRGYLTLDNLKDVEVPEDEVEKFLLQPADLLITEGGDWDKVGRTAIWRGEVERCLHQNHVFRARSCSNEFLPRWAELYLNSSAARAYFAGSSKQTTNLASINMTQLRSCAFPLPPLPEQHRIVAKVDELMALCDRLEARQQDAAAAHARLVQALLDRLTQARDAEAFQAAWQRVAGQFNDLFSTEGGVDALKQVILQAACSGRLVLSGRHKVAEPSARYLSDAAALAAWPFPIPSHWRWTKLGDLCALVTSGSRGWREFYADEGSTFIRSQDIKFDRLQFDQRAFVALPANAEGIRTQVQQGDLLVTITGANIGKAAVLNEAPDDAYVSQHVALVRLRDPRHAPCIHRWLINEYGGRGILLSSSYGAKPGLNLQNIKDLAVPLPPVIEQLETVAKVTELFALCDVLKVRIADARAKQVQLAAALVQQARA